MGLLNVWEVLGALHIPLCSQPSPLSLSRCPCPLLGPSLWPAGEMTGHHLSQFGNLAERGSIH